MDPSCHHEEVVTPMVRFPRVAPEPAYDPEREATLYASHGLGPRQQNAKRHAAALVVPKPSLEGAGASAAQPSAEEIGTPTFQTDGAVPVGPSSLGHLDLSRTPEAAPQGRAFATETLRDWPHLMDDASVLVSELITNAFRHGKGPIGLDILRLAQAVRVEVSDGSNKPPVLRTVSEDSEGGRGMFLVEQLAAAWGYSLPEDGGKVVWFDLNV